MLKKFMAIVFTISVLFMGAFTTQAASLEENRELHKATIVVEDFSNKSCSQVVDVSHIQTMSEAIQWVMTNAYGRNLRFVSVDMDLLQSWKNAGVSAGSVPKQCENDNAKISQGAKDLLRYGTKYSFEIKNKKSEKWKTEDIDKAKDVIHDLRKVFCY